MAAHKGAVTPRPKVRESVGDDVATLSTKAMYPRGLEEPPVQAWDGWAVGWQVPGWNQAFGFGSYDPDGYVSRVSTVMTCVDLNSRNLAAMPVYGVHQDFSRFILPSWRLSPEPEIYDSWPTFVKAMLNSYYLAGETILWATAFDAEGRPFRFVALDPGRVHIEDQDGLRRYWLTDGRGTNPSNWTQELDPMEVLHVPYQTLPGETRGIGPLQWTGRSLASAAALEVYAQKIAEHGVWAVLTHPDALTPKQANDLRTNWMANRAANPGSPAILSNGAEFETLSLSPRDMALLDLRVFDEQRIASAFGVPPFLVGLPQPGGFTYANASSLFDFHWRGTLRPVARTLAAAMSNWLLPRGRMLEFNADEYVQGNLTERAGAYVQMHSIGALDVEEVRAAERLQPFTPEQRAAILGSGTPKPPGPSTTNPVQEPHEEGAEHGSDDSA